MSPLQAVLIGAILVLSVVQAEQIIDIDNENDELTANVEKEADPTDFDRFKKSTNTAAVSFCVAYFIIWFRMCFITTN